MNLFYIIYEDLLSICIIMAVQEKMFGWLHLKTTSAERIHTVLKIMSKSVFIKVT